MHRGAWRATVHGVAESRTQLSAHNHAYIYKLMSRSRKQVPSKEQRRNWPAWLWTHWENRGREHGVNMHISLFASLWGLRLNHKAFWASGHCRWGSKMGSGGSTVAHFLECSMRNTVSPFPAHPSSTLGLWAPAPIPTAALSQAQ